MTFLIKLSLVLSANLMVQLCSGQQPPAPDKVYEELFTDVQLARIFPDGKTFVDCTPKKDPKEILKAYRDIRKNPAIRFSLKLFVEDNFNLPPAPPSLNYVMQEKNVSQHIKNLWSVLKRESDQKITGSSLLPLPGSYIVPGGRFREIYYWDSYFTMLGLKESGENATIENMINNFAYLINTYGHIPNGNRSYYLSRSQPPFFSLMVELLASIKGDGVYKTYLPVMEKEYSYWMDKTAATKHVVKMPDGTILNRYYDRDDIPRQEAYAKDVDVVNSRFPDNMVDTFRHTPADIEKMKKELYRHLRSGAESGWDFSSRWFADESSINTIHTTDFIPVDLNCLLYNLEMVIANAKRINQDKGAAAYSQKAAARKKAILKYCWNNKAGFFCDYDLKSKRTLNLVTAAGAFPLFVKIAGDQQAVSVSRVINDQLLKDGGLVTTNNHTKQQWDAPNGWAPLQWVAVKGLLNYLHGDIAEKIATRWLALNEKVYLATGKLMEKYNVEDMTKEAGGGEYPGQDGFGWTNGVYLVLKAMWPGNGVQKVAEDK